MQEMIIFYWSDENIAYMQHVTQRGISIDNLDFTKVDGVKLWRSDGSDPSDRGIALCKSR